jgi:hypothetical protein
MIYHGVFYTDDEPADRCQGHLCILSLFAIVAR